MKRAAIFLTLISVMVVVFAGVAIAAVIKGNDRPNYLVGTSRDDAIYGYGGADRIHARGDGPSPAASAIGCSYVCQGTETEVC